ncbi:iron complex transport system ATP-binding protein [Terribacillus halophilus]|uniref:Iron complex transport system ATP-binding protein n=1 Tax=Terribacillus halophilus TaxID=361279 RepID=A0A1G6LA10_9BACI|nr:ABC transporter ATP-binding protein [Terribacillus halophilus]SDC39963.1 iron complex transport system ATP-binding protein [Terribacillus halophilus]
MAIASLQDITIQRGDRVTLQASLEIPEGKITGIIGPNGSGKSTLLHSISNLLKLSSGKVEIKGHDVQTLKRKELAKQVTLLKQSELMPMDFLVQDIVQFGRLPYQNNWQKESSEGNQLIDWAMEECRISHLADRQVDTLSGGERQRVLIAMALVQQTDILLLDEPTTYLDVAHQLDLLHLLQRLHKNHGISIVLVLHDLNQAMQYCDHLVVMRKGAIYQTGEPEHIVTSELLKDVFQIQATISNESDKLWINPIGVYL